MISKHTILFYFALLLCSCSNFVSSKFITETEYETLVERARLFLIHNEKKLTNKDKQIILNTEPEFASYYQARKFGDFYLNWQITKGRMISAGGYGSMTYKTPFNRIIIVYIPGVKSNKNKTKTIKHIPKYP